MTEAQGIVAYDDIVFACTHLCDLLEVENEALTRHDVATVKDLATSKMALARLYEQSVQPMAADPDAAAAMDPDQRQELAQLSQRLQELVSVNARRLKAEMEACQRVMDVVVGAAKSNATNTVTYGRRGSFDAAAKGNEKNSLSFNKTL